MTYHPCRAGRASLVAGLVLSLGVVTAVAQAGRPRAEVTAVAAEEAARPGTTVRVSLDVALPPDVHVQSDAPRDPSLVPTVLAVDAPPGVTVLDIAYPPAKDLAQEGGAEPLAVFGPRFTIKVRLAIGDDVGTGAIRVPARLRYQACDTRSCYAPATARTSWMLDID